VLDNLIRFEQELHRLRPHLILLLQGHNDLYEMLHPAPADPDAPSEAATATPWGRWLERHSLLYGKATAALRNATGRLGRHQAPPPPEAMRASLDRGLAQFEVDVRSYVAVAQALGAHVVLIEPVHVSSGAGEASASTAELWGHAFGAVDPALVLEGYAREREVLRRVAEATGADFIPTDGFGLDSTRFYEPGDPIHFNDDGARVMAERLRAEVDRIVRLRR
jgi:lysophospholipase L1-like esterase